jgi:hypothetical protein
LVSELGSRQRIAVGALGAAEVVVVALVAATQTTGGAFSVAVALVLAPVAVVTTAALGAKISSGRFGVAAAAVYVLLPFLANRFMLPTYRGTFDAHALPALVGVQHTQVFALGVAAAVATLLLPRIVAAAGGVLAFVITGLAWQFAGVGHLTAAFHETVWSVTLLEWLLFAGLLGALLRSPLLALAIGGWLLAAIVWGAHRGYADAIFWESLAVAVPAAALVLSSLGLLVPRLRPERAREPVPSEH